MVDNSSLPEWLCIIPDHPNSFSKRLEVRARHLQDIKPHFADRRADLGGAILEKQPEGGATPSMKGSVFVLHGENEDVIRQRLAADVYAKSGVWDLEKAQIMPFKTALRNAHP